MGWTWGDVGGDKASSHHPGPGAAHCSGEPLLLPVPWEPARPRVLFASRGATGSLRSRGTGKVGEQACSVVVEETQPSTFLSLLQIFFQNFYEVPAKFFEEIIIVQVRSQTGPQQNGSSFLVLPQYWESIWPQPCPED